MRNKYGIKYSIEFYEDLEAITSYIKNELKNHMAVDRLVKKVEIEIEKRLQNPDSYEKYDTYGGYIYYKIYVDHYIIFYTVIEDVMEVRNIKYHKRDFSKLI